MHFLFILLLVGTLLVGLHLVLLYGFLPYATLGPALDAANHAAQLTAAPLPSQRLAHTAASYAHLRETACALAAAGFLGLAYWRRSARHEARRVARDARRAGRALVRNWSRQPWTARLGAVALLLAVAAVRTYFLLHNPFNANEEVTVDYFAAREPAVTAGFYLLPNNHVLYNLLAGALLRGSPGGIPDFLMRLPSFGLGLVGLFAGSAVLAHLTSLRVAALVTLLFQFSPMGVEYATTARGYGLQRPHWPHWPRWYCCGASAASAWPGRYGQRPARQAFTSFPRFSTRLQA